MLKKRDAISFVSALAIILRKEKANVSLSLNYKYKPGLLKMLDAFSPSPPLIFGMHTCDWFIVLMVCAHIWFHALVLRYHKAPRVWCVKEQQPSAARVLHIHYFNSEIRICRLLWEKKQKTPVSMAMSLKINFSLHVRVICYLVFFFTFIRERYSIIP